MRGGTRRRGMLIGAVAAAITGTALASASGTAGGAATASAPVRLPPVDRLVVDKSDRRMEVWAGGRIVHIFTGLQLGNAPEGHKQFEGDERTPEGIYTIDYGNGQSAYHLSLHISYPNARDRAFAEARGRSPGGMIFIHGQPNALGDRRMAGDWTDGCIALANHEIEALWEAVADGTEIDIRP